MQFRTASRILDHEPVKLVLTSFVAASVPNKQVNNLLKLLTTAAPIKELPHLKRVRKDPAGSCNDHLQVLVCQIANDDTAEASAGIPSSVQDILKANALETCVVQVPKHQPLTREHWQEWSAIWPISWRVPDASLVPDQDVVSPETQAAWEMWMRCCFDKAGSLGLSNYAMIVDPIAGELIAEGIDKTLDNPLNHPVMVAIAAAAQRDMHLWPEPTEGCGQKRANASEEVRAAGKRQKLDYSHIDSLSDVAPNSSKPYLCTGFDCFVICEPCTMCAMGLVHSRVARIIFCHTDAQHGAVCSKCKLQSFKSLNHHYNVYHLPLSSDEQV